MDPEKQKQLINTMYENTAKNSEELQNMDAEERRAYLKGRLKQRMFFTGASRQSMHQKKDYKLIDALTFSSLRE